MNRAQWTQRLAALIAPHIEARLGVRLRPYTLAYVGPGHGFDWWGFWEPGDPCRISVSPAVPTGQAVGLVLVHEFIHHALQGGPHDPAFCDAARRVGMVAPFTESHGGADLTGWLTALLGQLPAFPDLHPKPSRPAWRGIAITPAPLPAPVPVPRKAPVHPTAPAIDPAAEYRATMRRWRQEERQQAQARAAFVCGLSQVEMERLRRIEEIRATLNATCSIKVGPPDLALIFPARPAAGGKSRA